MTTEITLDPRAVAETLGVTTLDLATFLREKARALMIEASNIALNEPWYSHEDAALRDAALDDLVERAKRLMQAGFECDHAWTVDNEKD